MEKITLTGVQETMLQTVFARAQESTKQDGKIVDRKAEEIIRGLDYDFTLAQGDKTMSSGVIARTIVLDRLVVNYLKKNPTAVVINLACGLDTRCYRLGCYGRWYNLDLPDVVALRKKLLPEDGVISQISASAMDESWTDSIDADGKPVLVIIEGLTMYLSEAGVRKIFEIISAHFPKSTVFVETMSPFFVKNIKEKSIEGSHAKFTWELKAARRWRRCSRISSFRESTASSRAWRL